MFRIIKKLFKKENEIKECENKKEDIKIIETKAYIRISDIIEKLDNLFYFKHFTLQCNNNVCGYKINTNFGEKYIYINNGDLYKEICFSETYKEKEYNYYGRYNNFIEKKNFLAPDKILYVLRTTNQDNVLDIKIDQPKLDENNKGMSEKEIFLSILEIENYVNETIKNKDKLDNQHKENEQKFKERF